jgi:DNA-binding transcriptional LysR family regulator
MDLLALSAFNLVATHGGFGLASRASRQSKTTLSRRVRELEDSLGVRLIERGARAMRLTDAGAALHARTRQPLLEVDEAGRDVAAGLDHPRGTLRISAPVLFSHIAMGRIAAGLLAAFPDIVLELVAEDRTVDAIEERYDAIIRINPGDGIGLVGRMFFRDEMLLVAPPSLSPPEAAGPPVPAILMHDAPSLVTWTDPVSGQPGSTHLLPRARLSSLLVIRDAVLAGAGAALLPRSLVAGDLAAGRLIEWGVLAGQPIEAWVLHSSRRLVSPKVAAFVRFLCDAFPDARLRA